MPPVPWRKPTSRSKSNRSKRRIKHKVPPLPEGVKLHKDLNIQGVWLADGFSFKGYQTLYLTPVVFAGVERDNEVDIRALAMQELPAELVTFLRDTKLFDTVTTKSEDVKAKAKTLKLDNTIIEFSKGGGAARHFGGPFGAGGQPVIKVRGQIYDGDKLVCVYEIKRSGRISRSQGNGGNHKQRGHSAQRHPGPCPRPGLFLPALRAVISGPA
jgi:hypothetical protein